MLAPHASHSMRTMLLGLVGCAMYTWGSRLTVRLWKNCFFHEDPVTTPIQPEGQVMTTPYYIQFQGPVQYQTIAYILREIHTYGSSLRQLALPCNLALEQVSRGWHSPRHFVQTRLEYPRSASHCQLLSLLVVNHVHSRWAFPNAIVGRFLPREAHCVSAAVGLFSTPAPAHGRLWWLPAGFRARLHCWQCSHERPDERRLCAKCTLARRVWGPDWMMRSKATALRCQVVRRVKWA